MEKTILLVDDEEEVVSVEQEMLGRLGYSITARIGSVEALEAFRANPSKFDLIITDMTMPGITGDKLAGKMMAIRPELPVILSTGFSDLDGMTSGLQPADLVIVAGRPSMGKTSFAMNLVENAVIHSDKPVVPSA